MESEILKIQREYNEREERLQDVMKEVALFNLQENEDITDDEYKDEEFSRKSKPNIEASIQLNNEGITFFSGFSDCIYSVDTINKEVKKESLLKWIEIDKINDDSYLAKIENKLMFEGILKSMQVKKTSFRTFLRLLFTEIPVDTSDGIFYMLIQIINQTLNKNMPSLFEIFVEELSPGLLNLGADRKVIEKLLSNLPEPHMNTQQNKSNPTHNIFLVLGVFQNLLSKVDALPSNSKLKLDDIIFLLFVICQDNYIVNTSLMPHIQNVLALIIDLYPSDSQYKEKVQDLVELFADYWDSLPGEFNHRIASFVTCTVMPFSIRGQQLKTSLAFYSLMCCVTPEEVDVLDIVHLSTISKYILEHMEAFSCMDLMKQYSAIQLMDAAVERPIKNDQDRDYLAKILEFTTSFMPLESDMFAKARLSALIKEVRSEWGRLVDPGEAVGSFIKRKKTSLPKL